MFDIAAMTLAGEFLLAVFLRPQVNFKRAICSGKVVLGRHILV